MNKLTGWCVRGLAMLMLGGATAGVSAADLGFYVVADGAVTKADFPASDFHPWIELLTGSAEGSITDVRVNTSTKRFAMTVGYQLGTYFALEGTYLDMGKFTYDYIATDSDGATPVNHTGRFTLKPKGPTFSAVGLFPLGDYFSVDAHAGFSFLDSKNKLTYDSQALSYSESKTGIYYGAGFAWWITGQVALRAGYNRFERGVFEKQTSQYTLGLRYSYGY